MTGIVAAFGELLLRLSPLDQRLIVQAQAMSVEVGGAEANVLAGLASLGRRTALISQVADNALGRLATATLRARGVDTSQVKAVPGRMGLYFCEAGQGRRASAIVYDRQESTFARLCADEIDFAPLLDGVSLFHVSGITPALGSACAKLTLRAVKAARQQGVKVSFDCNYRAQLWAASTDDPRPILRDIVGHADIMFGNHRDITLLTGREFAGEGSKRRREAAECAFAAFPDLQLIASTARQVLDASQHHISARADSRDTHAETEEIAVTQIVDRIGSGDAFAAGVLHAWLNGAGCKEMVRTGLALCVLKHGLPGDMSCFGEADVAAFWSDVRDVRR